jgi:hypothetical protein
MRLYCVTVEVHQCRRFKIQGLGYWFVPNPVQDERLRNLISGDKLMAGWGGEKQDKNIKGKEKKRARLAVNVINGINKLRASGNSDKMMGEREGRILSTDIPASWPRSSINQSVKYNVSEDKRSKQHNYWARIWIMAYIGKTRPS